MLMHDLHSNTNIALGLAVIARTATANGAEIDTKDGRVAQFIIQTDTWTDGTHTFTFEHRDKTTDAWVACTEAELKSSAIAAGANSLVVDAADEDDTIYQVGYLGINRYVRVVHTVAGATVGMVSGVLVQYGGLRYAGVNPGDASWDAQVAV